METIKHEKKQKEELEYMKLCFKADRVLEKYQTDDVAKWKRKEDIVTYLKPLKKDGDEAMPKSRKGVEKRYSIWKHREHKVVDTDDDLLKQFEFWKLNFMNNEKDDAEQTAKNS